MGQKYVQGYQILRNSIQIWKLMSCSQLEAGWVLESSVIRARMFLLSVGAHLQLESGAGQRARWTCGEAQDSCFHGLYLELTPEMSCPLFPGSLLIELGRARRLGLSRRRVGRHSFPRESSMLAGTAIQLVWRGGAAFLRIRFT